jgi:hypothetical protein
MAVFLKKVLDQRQPAGFDCQDAKEVLQNINAGQMYGMHQSSTHQIAYLAPVAN